MKKVLHTLLVFFIFIVVILLGVGLLGAFVGLTIWILKTAGLITMLIVMAVLLIIVGAAALTASYLDYEKLHK